MNIKNQKECRSKRKHEYNDKKLKLFNVWSIKTIGIQFLYFGGLIFI